MLEQLSLWRILIRERPSFMPIYEYWTAIDKNSWLVLALWACQQVLYRSFDDAVFAYETSAVKNFWLIARWMQHATLLTVKTWGIINWIGSAAIPPPLFPPLPLPRPKTRTATRAHKLAHFYLLPSLTLLFLSLSLLCRFSSCISVFLPHLY